MQEVLEILKKTSVLVVEDDDMARELIISGLKPYCEQVIGACNGQDGVEKFKKQGFDIVMSDIHMPVLNGFEMMNEMKRIKPHQKFIVFTSYDSDENLIKSMEEGAMLFLKKPIDMKDLRSMLISLSFERDEKLVYLSDEVSINLKREKIYKNGIEIYLSFLQNKIFWLFAYNLNKLVTYEMIEEFVYESDVSKAAIQNVILRLKRELGVKFKNISESGYILITKSE
ncbi:response regulator transcription factor [Campylobacter concisus]|uniref:response regulator transcription factor n=1 Tax=Campylobacter concisus TaxID=199 RepID=UPI001883EF8E|nr:response regulator transcription factor [Campylobacter concisus]MBE9829785.1 response regulator transcription factor [Campylobacter concisus]